MTHTSLRTRALIAALAAALTFGAVPAFAASGTAEAAAAAGEPLVLADGRRDRREDRWDRREDRRDRREDRWDRREDHGRWDRREDRWDRREDRWDRREDRREWRREWRRGHYLPAGYYRPYPYWQRHGWRPAPRGYHYVELNGRYFLAAIATGVILEVLR